MIPIKKPKRKIYETTAKKMTELKKRICFLRQTKNETCDSKTVLHLLFALPSNGLRYLRWGGDGEAVQLEK